MLTFMSNKRSPGYCDGISRRGFLQVGSLALGGLTLPQLLATRAEAAGTECYLRDRSVVLLFLIGEMLEGVFRFGETEVVDVMTPRNEIVWVEADTRLADFLEIYKPYIHDGKTIVSSPHKVYGPENNDLMLQRRKRGIDKVILAGMSANLCVESHLRELLERGFEVAVVKDATAAAQVPGLDGYLAAVINFRFIANTVWTTEEAVKNIEQTLTSK